MTDLRLIKATKQIAIQHITAPIIFLFLLTPSLLFKLFNRINNKKLWLIAEEGDARDNGYHFYKYIREKHPNDYCFYAIKSSSADCKKVQRLGNTIRFKSLKHWLYYMSADLNISNHKSGNPCPIFWYFIHVTLNLYKNRVFLQHGVTLNDVTWLHYDKTKFKYFVTATKSEYAEVVKNFGYPQKSIILTGFSRWDNLKDISSQQKQKSILIMPTWRKYLGIQNNALFNKNDFEKSSYFKAWNELLNDGDFISFIEKECIEVYFYPHQNVQPKLGLFHSPSDNIKLLSMSEDISEYLSKCSIMITDYSSVMFDFAYLQKPVIYYQFDKEEFHTKQYGEGYFGYEKDGFGPVVSKEKELIRTITEIYKNGLAHKYSERIKSTIPSRDTHNSERIYAALAGDKND